MPASYVPAAGPVARAAGRRLGDAGPAAAVEADAEQQLRGRDAEALELRDGRVGVEALLSGCRGTRSAASAGPSGPARPRRRRSRTSSGCTSRRTARRPRSRPRRSCRRSVASAVIAAVTRLPLPNLARSAAITFAVGVAAAGVAGQAAGVGVLPVDVDAVEDVRPARVLDQVVAGLGERGRVLARPRRSRPTRSSRRTTRGP